MMPIERFDLRGFGNDSDDDQVSLQNDDEDEVLLLEGQSFERFGDVQVISPDEAIKPVVAARAKIRPVDLQIIECMREEGVTEELAVKAFVGLFGGNEVRTAFF